MKIWSWNTLLFIKVVQIVKNKFNETTLKNYHTQCKSSQLVNLKTQLNRNILLLEFYCVFWYHTYKLTSFTDFNMPNT